MQIQPPRVPWNRFPDVVIHAPETSVKKHPAYRDAKAGDDEAAHTLVVETLSAEAVRQLLKILGEERPFLASAQALERDGVNAIPEALADELAGLTGLLVDGSIVQTNIVGQSARLHRVERWKGHRCYCVDRKTLLRETCDFARPTISLED